MNNDCFGEAAVSLSGAASLLLGWRPQEFWSATPAELASAMKFQEIACAAPDPNTIAMLRQQFPDDEKE